MSRGGPDGAIVDFEMFLRELQAAHARSDRFQRRVDANGGVSAGEALPELQTALEELRVTEEELRVQNEQLTGLYAIDADRDRWQDLFEHAPVALLLTDPLGIIREVNRRGVVLLHMPRSFLVGRPTGQLRRGAVGVPRPAAPAG